MAGTWGNGPVHHLPGMRRAVRPAVAGLRLVCATHDAGSATSASRTMLASWMSFEKPGAMSSAVGCKVFSPGILLGLPFAT
jgi:hypothetical protein